MAMQLYMVVEHFKGGDAIPVYRRFQEQGRLAPEGVVYVSSWVDASLEHCFQLMEADDRAQLERWIDRWRDLVDFEVFPVLTSDAAVARVGPLLGG